MAFDRKQYYKDRYKANKEKHSQMMKDWHKANPEYLKDWCKANPEKRRRYLKIRDQKAKVKHRIKLNSRQILKSAIRSGYIKMQNCIVCGNSKSEGHHYDYNRPLSVIWLCNEHHRKIHNDEEFRSLWENKIASKLPVQVEIKF